jgi:hypothetical protein
MPAIIRSCCPAGNEEHFEIRSFGWPAGYASVIDCGQEIWLAELWVRPGFRAADSPGRYCGPSSPGTPAVPWPCPLSRSSCPALPGHGARQGCQKRRWPPGTPGTASVPPPGTTMTRPPAPAA